MISSEHKRILRFVLVGVLNTGWSYVLYAGLLYSGLGFVLASLLTILLSVGFGYLTQGHLVFGGTSRAALFRFIAVWVLIYGVYLMVVELVHRFGASYYLGGLIATPVVAGLSYLLQSRFVFRPHLEVES